MNEAFAARFVAKKKKGTRRKTRHLRVIERNTAWLVSVGVDPSEVEAPVA